MIFDVDIVSVFAWCFRACSQLLGSFTFLGFRFPQNISYDKNVLFHPTHVEISLLLDR